MHKAILTSLALCASAFAQTTVPAGFLTTEGSGSTSWPFGLSTPARFQQLYGKNLVGSPTLVIREIAFRGQGSRANAAKSGIEVEIAISSSPKTIFDASTTFAQNRGTDWKVVFNKKTINIPAHTGTASPQPWTNVFKLDTAFVYARSKGNLLIEYIVTKNVAGAYSHDTEFNATPVFTPVGSPCSGASQSVTGGRATSATSTTTFTLASGPANAAAVHILAAAKLPAPVKLPNGGCNLEIAPTLFAITTTDGNGAATMRYPTPVGTRDTLGPVIFGQWLTVTATKWDTTQAHSVKIGGYLSHGRIYHRTDPNATTAQSRQIGSSIIHRIQ